MVMFHIKRNDELLAVLESCKPSEMFWLTCKFKPTNLFVDIEPLIREASESEDVNVFERNYSQLRDMRVRLIRIQDNVEFEYFAIHIDDDNVELRYA